MDTNHAPNRDPEETEFQELCADLKPRGWQVALKHCHPEHCMLGLTLPNGRETREVLFTHPRYARGLLDISREQYVFVGPYEAIASYTSHFIEVGLEVHGVLDFLLLRALGARQLVPQVEGLPPTLELSVSRGSLRIALGPPSTSWKAICWPASQFCFLSAKITGIQVSRHDQALEIVEKVLFSLLFQIDVATSARVDAIRHRDWSATRSSADLRPADVRFPESEYDPTPLELYWYARSAESMPLHQFLAFYQVLEYYFVAYSRAGAQNRVQDVLRDPSFRLERTADINRVLNAVQGSAYDSAANERSQLRATIAAVASDDDIRAFIIENELRKEFFSAKHNELSKSRILLNQNDDTRVAAADRIYDIRCRIVHSKNAPGSSGEVELISPFSREANMLDHDIALVRFLAQKVLISASVPLRAISAAG
jgi:hypothetical protein